MPDPSQNLEGLHRELLSRMYDELIDCERKMPAAGFPSSSYQARHPYYELVLCAEHLDIPRSAAFLDTWVQGKKSQGVSMEKIDQFARDQVTNLRREIQRILHPPQGPPEVTPSRESTSDEKPPRRSKPARPKSLKELAARVRLQGPRSRNVPEFLELIDRLIQTDAPVTIHFDDIRENCHAGENVEDDTVRKTIKRARRAIGRVGLPYTVKQSGHTAVVRKNLA